MNLCKLLAALKTAHHCMNHVHELAALSHCHRALSLLDRRFTGEAPLPGSAEVIGKDTRVVQEAAVSREERGAVRHRTEFADVSKTACDHNFDHHPFIVTHPS